MERAKSSVVCGEVANQYVSIRATKTLRMGVIKGDENGDSGLPSIITSVSSEQHLKKIWKVCSIETVFKLTVAKMKIIQKTYILAIFVYAYVLIAVALDEG